MSLISKILLTALLTATLLPLADAKGNEEAVSFSFNGQTYLHRWSEKNQHEFTPSAQEDLDHWDDMITINVLPDSGDADTLATSATNTLTYYQNAGTVVRTGKIDTADGSPEFLVVAVLGNGQLLEANFARFIISDGVGLEIISQHRIYGTAVEDAMSAWLSGNGPSIEDKLVAWDGTPTVKVLRALSH
jgi:hypothetical protein